LKRVLVIDDESTIRQLVADTLTEAGYRTETAANGADGLRAMGERVPDAIVLDLMMPVLDATGFLHLMRLNRRFARVPVLLISAAYDAANAAHRLGVRACLSKPFELEQLVAAVEGMIGPPGRRVVPESAPTPAVYETR
jgi:DNA-binding response OmpR family regulator